MNDLDFSLGDESAGDSASGALRDYRVWRRNFPTDDFAEHLERNPGLDAQVIIELATTDLIQQIMAGFPGRTEAYLSAIPENEISPDLKLDLVDAEICAKSDMGQDVSREEFLERFPSLQEELVRMFEVHEIDLEASNSWAEYEPPTITVPGYKLVRRTHIGNADSESSDAFEIWDANREVDDEPFQVILWQASPSGKSTEWFESALEKRRRVEHANLINPLDGGTTANDDRQQFRYVVTEPLGGKLLAQLLEQAEDGALSEQALAKLLLKIHDARDSIEESLGTAISVSINSIFLEDNIPLLVDFPAMETETESDPLLQLGLFLFSACMQDSDSTELRQHLEAGHAPIALTEVNSSISKELDSIYLSCVHPEKKKRYESIDEAMEDLRRLVDGKPIRTASRRRRWFGR